MKTLITAVVVLVLLIILLPLLRFLIWEVLALFGGGFWMLFTLACIVFIIWCICS